MSGLADKAIPDRERRMGRKPLGQTVDDTKPTPVRFEAGMRAQIDKARGTQPFAAFIREAVQEKLDRSRTP